MLLGISFSIINIFSVDAKAGGLKGSWEDYEEGTKCEGSGTECDIDFDFSGI